MVFTTCCVGGMRNGAALTRQGVAMPVLRHRHFSSKCSFSGKPDMRVSPRPLLGRCEAGALSWLDRQGAGPAESLGPTGS